MATLDIHTHAFPDALAERAIASLEAGCTWKAFGNGTVAGLIESMDAADIDVSVICAIATKPEQAEGIFKWCQKIRSDRIEPFPSIHPDTPKADKWLANIAKAGFMGIKLHPMYQDFAIDEPRMDRIYQAAMDNHLIVQWHCGLDVAFPPTDKRASVDRIRRVIDKYPDMTVVLTHMGGWRSWDDVEKHLLGCDVYLETSFSLDQLPPDRTVEMIERHGRDRILFGSDWPWAKQDESIRMVKQLGLDEKTTKGILWSNAAKLLGLLTG